MVLPFEPLTISFKDVQYYVDTPPEMRQHAFKEKKLQLLKDITGAFSPGIPTAWGWKNNSHGCSFWKGNRR
ncbi:hypothetical protein COP2_012301 [Malus domestica]